MLPLILYVPTDNLSCFTVPILPILYVLPHQNVGRFRQSSSLRTQMDHSFRVLLRIPSLRPLRLTPRVFISNFGNRKAQLNPVIQLRRPGELPESIANYLNPSGRARSHPECVQLKSGNNGIRLPRSRTSIGREKKFGLVGTVDRMMIWTSNGVC